jgi:hypothetical protein
MTIGTRLDGVLDFIEGKFDELLQRVEVLEKQSEVNTCPYPNELCSDMVLGSEKYYRLDGCCVRSITGTELHDVDIELVNGSTIERIALVDCIRVRFRGHGRVLDLSVTGNSSLEVSLDHG